MTQSSGRIYEKYLQSRVSISKNLQQIVAKSALCQTDSQSVKCIQPILTNQLLNNTQLLKPTIEQHPTFAWVWPT